LTIGELKRGPFARIAQLREAARYDAVILQRKLLPAWQLAILRDRARRLIYDFDDAILFRDSYDRRGPRSAWRERRFVATVRTADVVVAGNDFLADCALRAGAPAERVRLIPTCVNPRLYPQPGTSRSSHDKSPFLDLVWIGSSSTLQGLEQQRSLWDRIGGELPGVRLRVICDRFPSFSAIPVVPVRWTLESEAAELAAGQIGISWLPDDVWSRGKCGLKVIQYQAAGLPVVANPVGSNSELIEPGATGFLASTADEWVQSVRLLAADRIRRERMGRLARERVESGYSVDAWAETFVASVSGYETGQLVASTLSGGPRQGPIPTPFLIRLRRMEKFQGSVFAGGIEGNRNS
jgi:glycosyltransferase involved in cell wall biosynthesis